MYTKNNAQEPMKQTAWASACGEKRLDTEMMIQLRIALCPIFDDAESWSDLRAGLQTKGFYVKRHEGRMFVHDDQSNVPICTCSTLGFPAAELDKRFRAEQPAGIAARSDVTAHIPGATRH